MADSKIEWTDKTWPVVTGCSHAGSPGCDNCYAARMAATRLKHHQRYRGLAEMKDGKPRWTGEVRLNRDVLDQPLHWRKTRMVFVASMGDLFHPKVPFEFVEAVFMFIADFYDDHIFQILTKRPQRMKQWFDWASHVARQVPDGRIADNIWLGVTAENQRTAEERIPTLLETPAAVRFVSCEPLLGPVDLTHYLHGMPEPIGGGIHYVEGWPVGEEPMWQQTASPLDWVIVGGESGPNARPMHPAWARRIRDDCMEAGVPLFFKQWGAWAARSFVPQVPWQYSNRQWAAGMFRRHRVALVPPNPEDPSYQNGDCVMMRVGKKKAGRLLDGHEWNEMPEKAIS